MTHITPGLTQRLIEKTLTLQPTPQEAISFEALLSSPTQCAKDSGPALKWARSSQEFSHLLPETNSDVLKAISLPLLAWGIRQPWAKDISMLSLLDYWSSGLGASTGEFSYDKCLSMIWATHLVRACVEFPETNPDRVNDLRRNWVDLTDANGALWQWTRMPPEQLPKMYAAWADVGHIATPSTTAAPNLLNLDTRPVLLEKSWLQLLGRAVKAMPVAQQSTVLVAVLASTLCDTTKRAACHKAAPQAWLDPTVHAVLRPILSANDRACHQELPWLRSNATITKTQSCRINESLANMYCPILAPLCSLLLNAEQWSDRNAVQRAFNQTKISRLPSESLSIEGLVFPM